MFLGGRAYVGYGGPLKGPAMGVGPRLGGRCGGWPAMSGEIIFKIKRNIRDLVGSLRVWLGKKKRDRGGESCSPLIPLSFSGHARQSAALTLSH
jgi:hypothetical protein